ncbi:hypothetical protein ACIRO3_29725 [Streptomyces sp. NPDC102278]|uniref:hypothetical protein n=1 Tax=Streptomyces sp. NPDC102278 TaxID=3366152 RepID=UPI0037F798AC
MDLLVRWTDGSVSLFQGADHNDPQYPFAAEHKVATPNSVWRYARALTAGTAAPGPARDVLVRWTNGGLSLFPAIDHTGTHAEVKLVE